jgi:CHASE2 domain-containing sensor protein
MTLPRLKSLSEHQSFRPITGVVLAILCGLVLWGTPLGAPFEDASYDYLFRFGNRAVTNKVVLIQIDNAACRKLGQTRATWDRVLHAELLKHLTEGRCPIVVFDIFFGTQRSTESDATLAQAIRRHGRVVLMEEIVDQQHPLAQSAQSIPPCNPFRDAAADLGIAKTEANQGETARRHWPFPAPAEGPFLSLPWVAARRAGALLSETPQKQWLRYYSESGPWEAFSYHLALSNSATYFRDKIVFIGNKPENDNPNQPEPDKFRTPYTHWNDTPVGGMEILATTFLNLMNGDWLRRPARWTEFLILSVIGVLLGSCFCLVRLPISCATAVGAMLVSAGGGVMLSYFTNWWFPWLVVAGGQVPCALLWAVFSNKLRKTAAQEHQPAARKLAWALGPTEVMREESAPVSSLGATTVSLGASEATVRLDPPDAPEYELFDPPFGEGSFGKVWLVRNAIGQWQALKAVYQAKFGQKTGPYEAEFKGIKRYKPVSDKHPGLLRVDFVTRKKQEGYFYYVMELGDSQTAGWEARPETYKPRDLSSVRTENPAKHLPPSQCLQIGVTLADALDFLHRQGLTHRDIKPSNIIFVNGIPKLADVGLVTDIRPDDEVSSWAGTPSYMPPPPEPPGTVQADIYALGKVLYVISTGRDPQQFPEVPKDAGEQGGLEILSSLMSVIHKACQTDRSHRYQSAGEMLEALKRIKGN